MLKLSRDEEMRHFRNIIFVGNIKDKYAPVYSSIAEAYTNSPAHIEEITGNINRLRPRIHKVLVWGDIKETALESLVGRKKHVYFLDTDGFISLLLRKYRPYFSQVG